MGSPSGGFPFLLFREGEVDAVVEAIRHHLHFLVVYEVNGLLVVLYTVWERIAAFVVLAAGGLLVWNADKNLRPWLAGAGGLAAVGALVAGPPAPFLLALMAVAGALAVRLDRFTPDVLRWRVAGGLALYALAAMGLEAYRAYLAGLDAAAWAAAIGGQGEAQATLAQGRAFVETLATWGIWFIIPLGYFSLLVQAFLAHPPAPGRADDLIETIRTRQRQK